SGSASAAGTEVQRPASVIPASTTSPSGSRSARRRQAVMRSTVGCRRETRSQPCPARLASGLGLAVKDERAGRYCRSLRAPPKRPGSTVARMPATAMVTVTRHAEARAVLGDPRFVVPPVPAGAAQGVAWLRAEVARFSNGSTHERRRALAVAELDRVSPETLRRRSAGRVSALLTVDMAQAVPVDVLADALGVTTTVSAAVALVASGYHPGTDAGPAGDDAVTHLVELFGGTPDEVTAARIGLLVQAYEVTAGLIGNAVRAILRWQL